MSGVESARSRRGGAPGRMGWAGRGKTTSNAGAARGSALAAVAMADGYIPRHPYRNPGERFTQWVDLYTIFVRTRARTNACMHACT